MNQKTINKIIRMLDRFREIEMENEYHSSAEIAFYKRIQPHLSFQSAMYVPHIENYEPVLAVIKPSDVVFDAGAGDLRFSLMVSQKAAKVYAIEVNPMRIALSLSVIGFDLPANMNVICGDWFNMPVPDEVTVGTCLVNNPKPTRLWAGHNTLFACTDGTITKIDPKHELTQSLIQLETFRDLYKKKLEMIQDDPYFKDHPEKRQETIQLYQSIIESLDTTIQKSRYSFHLRT